jgi:hypothetical protein
MKFVSLAAVIKAHGIPKDQKQSYKIKIFNEGSALWDSLAELYRLDTGEALRLVEAPRPLKAGWRDATEALIKVPEKPELPAGLELGVEREALPKLPREEFYLCDIWGYEVLDEKGRAYGKLGRFYSEHSGQLNLVAENEKGEMLEFPASWIEEVRTDSQQLVVPEVYEWKLS